jgi:cell wall-associated NlpC family hydrolase
MLAAYNPGAASVTAAGGIPPIRQTQNYVSAIDAKIKRYTAKPAGSSQTKIPARSGPVIKKTITILKSKLGTPYSFGGGTVSKPTVGRTSPAGWDCSSYMMMGWYQASGGKIKLERTTGQQVHSNLLKPVSKKSLRVGDMIYIKTEGGSYSHVVMYLGHHKIIEEPHTGAAARINPVSEYNGKTQAVRRMKTSQTNQDA